jgi:FtsP/CotA-like multicopper oxidase with cupredoxin domain
MREPSHCGFVQRWLRIALVVIAAIILHALPARAQQYVPCPPEQQPLLRIPEIVSSQTDHKLRGTMMLSDEQERIAFRLPPGNHQGDPGTLTKCQPQFVRILRGLNAAPVVSPNGGPYPDPMPGPTLRARVGDLIQLTFINQIYAKHFGDSIDNGEKGFGCDQVTGVYPKKDTFPDCFHGSSTGNIHFHGTHTNPNSTGDNVFIEVRPLPRNPAGNLTTSTDQIQKSLEQFYAQCDAKLSRAGVLSEWPKTWSDLPKEWTDQQKKLLKEYDQQLFTLYGDKAKQLWPVDEQQIKQEAWPQYYIGAYPYCYRLPEYTASTWPPALPAPMNMNMSGTSAAKPNSGGAGTAEMDRFTADSAEQGYVSPVLIMGQSPGTHWYHAHKHGSTAIDVANGMTGAFIIEGQYDDDLNTWYGAGWTRTQPVMVINQLGVSPNLMRGGSGGAQTDKGPDFSVNGQLNPVISMKPGEVQMWRIVNTSGRAGAYFLGPPTGFQWKQLAQDGVQFQDTTYQHSLNNTFLMMAGNRVDLLVKAPTTPGKYPVQVKNEVDQSDLFVLPKINLMTVSVAGTPVTPGSNAAAFITHAPAPPPYLRDIDSSEVQGKKEITFASTGPPFATHTINGKQFDGDVGEVVLLNTVEEWKIVNKTYANNGPAISHPFHIHINPFQVTEVFSPFEILTDANGNQLNQISNATGKVVLDPTNSNQPLPAHKYVFIKDYYNPKTYPGQCLLDPLKPDTWKPCGKSPSAPLIWWDTFPVPTGVAVLDGSFKPILDPNNCQIVKGVKTCQQVTVPGYFKMRSRFVDYSGYYVIHCHILAHEDRGMMTIVEVAPVRSPYSHN